MRSSASQAVKITAMLPLRAIVTAPVIPASQLAVQETFNALQRMVRLTASFLEMVRTAVRMDLEMLVTLAISAHPIATELGAVPTA